MTQSEFLMTLEYENMPGLSCGLKPHLFQSPTWDRKPSIFNQLRHAWALFKESRQSKIILLDSTSGSIHPDLLAAVLLSFLPRDKQPIIAFLGDMWEPNSGLRGLIERILIRLSDRATDGYIVQTSEELTKFPEYWGINPSKMEVALYFYTFLDEDIQDDALVHEDYIFAGGNSHRNYEDLLETIRRLPEHRFILGTRLLNGRDDLPDNLTAGLLPQKDYQSAMENASIVITPIKDGLLRGAGQQTYLNAMRLGKISIVNKGTLGAHDHIENGKNGFIVEGTPESYVDIIRWICDPANQAEVAGIREQAKRDVMKKFTYERYVANVTSALNRIIERSAKVSAKVLRSATT